MNGPWFCGHHQTDNNECSWYSVNDSTDKLWCWCGWQVMMLMWLCFHMGLAKITLRMLTCILALKKSCITNGYWHTFTHWLQNLNEDMSDGVPSPMQKFVSSMDTLCSQMHHRNNAMWCYEVLQASVTNGRRVEIAWCVTVMRNKQLTGKLAKYLAFK